MSISSSLGGVPSFPISKDNTLLSKIDSGAWMRMDTLPNEPGIVFSEDYHVLSFLREELLTLTLDELSTRWGFAAAARPAGCNVDALHEQLLRKRSVTITEDPGLHLVWWQQEVFLKPIPFSLLSFAVWQQHIIKDEKLFRAAVGFVRSYSFLIRHESDFLIARRANLIPEVPYCSLKEFLAPFRDIPDASVSLRYRYGQIRLSRLNWALRLHGTTMNSTSSSTFLNRLYYRQHIWSIEQALRDQAPLLLFVFAALQLVLSSLQVGVGATQDDRELLKWPAFYSVSRGFSVAVIFVVVLCVVTFVVFVLGILLWQLSFAFRARRRKTTDISVQRSFQQ